MAEKKFLVDLNLDGNEIKQVLLEGLATDPTGTTKRIYYNTTNNVVRYYNGREWLTFATGGDATAIKEQLDTLQEFVWGADDDAQDGGLVADIEQAQTTANNASLLAGQANTAAGNAQADVNTLETAVLTAIKKMFDVTADETDITAIVKSLEDVVKYGNGANTTSKWQFYKNETNSTYELRYENTSVASFPYTEFVKDSFLSGAEVVTNPSGQTAGTYMHFTFNTTDGGANDIYVNVGSLIDVYKAGNGINIDTNKNVSVKGNGNKGIEVDSDGVAVKVDGTNVVFGADGKLNLGSTVKQAINGINRVTTELFEGVSKETTIDLEDISSSALHDSIIDVTAIDESGKPVVIDWEYVSGASGITGIKVLWNGTETLTIKVTYFSTFTTLK